MVLERTPFYAESGGQDSDAGTITGDGVVLEVVDVQRPVKGLIVHRVRVTAGELLTGANVLAAVDGEWRLGACQAHSGTHVMHAALRQVLGPTALQSGSYNKPGYLRLDFAWPSGLSQRVRSDVEEAANQAIRSDLNVTATYMPLATAREIGALALFGETYDEEVRVVEMGGPWSRELCGGTHVQHSSQIGLVTLTGESSVGSGLRRVEAFVGIEAFHHLAKERALVLGLTDLLKVQPDQLPDRVAKLVAQLKAAEKQIADLKSRDALADVGAIVAGRHDLWGVGYFAHRADGVSRQRPAHPGSRGAQPGRRRTRRHRRGRRPAGQAFGGDRHHRRAPATADSRPASWCAPPARPLAAGVAARTTSPRAAGPTAPGSTTRSRRSSTPSVTSCRRDAG